MLRVVYGGAYGPHRTAIERSALIRSYAKQVLLGLVLHVLCSKLSCLATRARGALLAAASAEIGTGLRRLRDSIAALAEPDHTAFVNRFIELWSRGLTIFRSGRLPPAGSQTYEAITRLSELEMAAEPNIGGSGLPELAAALGLLGMGEAEGKWTLLLPRSSDIDQGIFQATGTVSAKTTQIFFVNSVSAALELIKQGALTNTTNLVFHSDDAWQQMMDRGSASRRSPMGGPLSGRRRPDACHVSMRKLITEARDIASLRQRFEEEMTL